MKWLLDILKVILSAWFTARREDSDREKLKEDLKKLEAEYENAKEKRAKAFEVGATGNYYLWAVQCRRLSTAICDLRTRLGQNPVE